MSKTKLFTPLNLIIAGLALIVLFQFDFFGITLSTVNLVDPQTNVSYSCNATYDCYQKVSGQITGTQRGPALACISGRCAVQECEDGEEITRSCQAGGTITVSRCEEGKIVYPDEQCPIPECLKDTQCISAADTTCSGKLSPVFGQCVNTKCQYIPTPRCSDVQLFFNKYKIYIISSILVLLGIGAFIFAHPKINILRK